MIFGEADKDGSNGIDAGIALISGEDNVNNLKIIDIKYKQHISLTVI